jgi:hypothetical protein
MAEDIRGTNTGESLMDERTRKLAEECQRQEDSCLYTSAALSEWLKSLRTWRGFFVVAPIVLGSIATSSVIKTYDGSAQIAGGCALLAGMATAVYKALGLDVSPEAIAKHAHEFKVLQGRFRQARHVTALGPFDEFKTEFGSLMERMDAARAGSLTAPERFFQKGRSKIQKAITSLMLT